MICKWILPVPGIGYHILTNVLEHVRELALAVSVVSSDLVSPKHMVGHISAEVRVHTARPKAVSHSSDISAPLRSPSSEKHSR